MPIAHDDEPDELVHDDECTCARCERAAIRDADARAQRVIAANGIAVWGHEVLGSGWVDRDGKGETMITISTEELAQRALGDVFEQIGRIAAAGREKCRAGSLYTSMPMSRDQLVKRHEAVALLRFCENALDYARVHLDYLDVDDPERLDDADNVACEACGKRPAPVLSGDGECYLCSQCARAMAAEEVEAGPVEVSP